MKAAIYLGAFKIYAVCKYGCRAFYNTFILKLPIKVANPCNDTPIYFFISSIIFVVDIPSIILAITTLPPAAITSLAPAICSNV